MIGWEGENLGFVPCDNGALARVVLWGWGRALLISAACRMLLSSARFPFDCAFLENKLNNSGPFSTFREQCVQDGPFLADFQARFGPFSTIER